MEQSEQLDKINSIIKQSLMETGSIDKEKAKLTAMIQMLGDDYLTLEKVVEDVKTSMGTDWHKVKVLFDEIDAFLKTGSDDEQSGLDHLYELADFAGYKPQWVDEKLAQRKEKTNSPKKTSAKKAATKKAKSASDKTEKTATPKAAAKPKSKPTAKRKPNASPKPAPTPAPTPAPSSSSSSSSSDIDFDDILFFVKLGLLVGSGIYLAYLFLSDSAVQNWSSVGLAGMKTLMMFVVAGLCVWTEEEFWGEWPEKIFEYGQPVAFLAALYLGYLTYDQYSIDAEAFDKVKESPSISSLEDFANNNPQNFFLDDAEALITEKITYKAELKETYDRKVQELRSVGERLGQLGKQKQERISKSERNARGISRESYDRYRDKVKEIGKRGKKMFENTDIDRDTMQITVKGTDLTTIRGLERNVAFLEDVIAKMNQMYNELENLNP